MWFLTTSGLPALPAFRCSDSFPQFDEVDEDEDEEMLNALERSKSDVGGPPRRRAAAVPTRQAEEEEADEPDELDDDEMAAFDEESLPSADEAVRVSRLVL